MIRRAADRAAQRLVAAAVEVDNLSAMARAHEVDVRYIYRDNRFGSLMAARLQLQSALMLLDASIGAAKDKP